MALPLWPYERTCGLRLMFFMGAAGITALVGILGALASWGSRRGFAHVLSLAVIACSSKLSTVSSTMPLATTRSRIGWWGTASARTVVRTV